MDLIRFVRTLRKYWWMIVAAAVLAAGIGVLITARTPKLYESTVTFFVKTPTDQVGSAYQGDQFGQKRVNSYVQLIGSQRLADLIRTDTKLDITTQQVMSEITAKGDINTVLLTATVTDHSAARSLAIARSVATQFVALVATLETPAGSTTPTVTLETVTAAALNPTPVQPKPINNIGIGLALGLLIGLALAMLRDALDTSIRSVEDLRRVIDVPVLGSIVFDPSAKASPLIVHSQANSNRAEAFRQLRTNLQFINVDAPAKVLVVTSSIAEEGKSSTATNLAVSFAEAGQKVLLIEGDLRRPRVADYLGLEGAVGLSNVLAGQVEIDSVLQPWGAGGLTVLPSGSIPPNPSELLGSKNMEQLLTVFKGIFDIILIDTPPLLPVTDGAIAAANSDGAILVVRHGRTSRTQVHNAAVSLRTVDAHLIGTVLNMAPAKGADADTYGYGYYSSHEGTGRPSLEAVATELESSASKHVADESDRTARPSERNTANDPASDLVTHP